MANKLHATEVDVNVIKTKDDGCDHVQFAITQKVKPERVSEPEIEEFNMLSLENKISPLTFCKAFPFHLVFDRNLVVRQVNICQNILLEIEYE